MARTKAVLRAYQRDHDYNVARAPSNEGRYPLTQDGNEIVNEVHEHPSLSPMEWNKTRSKCSKDGAGEERHNSIKKIYAFVHVSIAPYVSFLPAVAATWCFGQLVSLLLDSCNNPVEFNSGLLD